MKYILFALLLAFACSGCGRMPAPLKMSDSLIYYRNYTDSVKRAASNEVSVFNVLYMRNYQTWEISYMVQSSDKTGDTVYVKFGDKGKIIFTRLDGKTLILSK